MDDATPESLGFAMEKLFEAGCRDAFFTPIYMKKNRPAYLITVLCDAEQAESMAKLLFLHTTTIGVRMKEVQRLMMEREKGAVSTPYGEIEIKRCSFEDIQKDYVEYESAKQAAIRNNVAIDQVYRCVYRELLL